jgi:hypothetical protein
MARTRVTVTLQSKINSSPDFYTLRWLQELAEGVKDKNADRYKAYNKVFNNLGSDGKNKKNANGNKTRDIVEKITTEAI